MATLPTQTCDVLVIGSGGAGLAAAIAARLQGLEVLVVEKAEHVGGTTAISGGSLWVPANPVSARSGAVDSPELGRRYVQQFLPGPLSAAGERWLDEAPRMIAALERDTDLRFYAQEGFPDFRPQLDGGLAQGGRTICAEPFDARALGAQVALLPPPLYTQTALGMMTTPRDLHHFQNFTRSWRSFAYVARRFARHRRDLATHGRTMWLTNGNALVARLLATLLRLRVPVWTGARAAELVEAEGAVRGARVEREGGSTWVAARRGVVLACGGFGHDAALCAKLLPRPALEGRDWSMAAAGHDGDGFRLAAPLGAATSRPGLAAALWAPVSAVPTLGGMLHGHYCDRSKPPVIAVTPQGRRFTDEASGYHDFGEALLAATPPGQPAQAWLVTDHRGLRRYGLGAVLARPFPIRRHLESGYLLRGRTLGELASRAGIDAAALEAAVEQYNRGAGEGVDAAFGKGGNAWDRHYGSAARRPNPCLGPIDAAPFYAVRVTAGHMGTTVGLDTDEQSRVRDERGRPIAGLYAVGEAATHPFGGSCPGAGTMLTAALTGGWIAGHDIARASAATPQRQDAAAEAAA